MYMETCSLINEYVNEYFFQFPFFRLVCSVYTLRFNLQMQIKIALNESGIVSPRVYNIRGK